MLKQLVNECIVDFKIHTDGPLLIKSGKTESDGLDMSFVKTSRGGFEPEIYIPGSSLKGLIRSYSEKITRTLSSGQVKCCDPFQEDNKEDHTMSCSEKFEKRKEEKIKSHTVYAASCPICKLFGSTRLSSRFNVEDGYLENTNEVKLQSRNGVAIDRHLGKVAEGPFDFEVAENAIFKTRIYINNFEVWQLGLLAFTLTDFQEGLAKMGYGKSRGFGKFHIEIANIKISYLIPNIIEQTGARQPLLIGLKKLCPENNYNFSKLEKEKIPIEGLALNLESDNIGFRKSYNFDSEDKISALFKVAASQFNLFLKDWKWSDEMKFEYMKSLRGGN